MHLRSYDFISHGIQVVERLDESLPQVIGDSHQLQQVFLNILNNAYDAVRETARPARIEIMSARAGESRRNFFPRQRPRHRRSRRIFDPFFTTKDVGKGTGLGLSICYGIVREHGGEIVCHNNLDSEGATFIVRLPVATETASFGAVAGVQPSMTQTGTKPACEPVLLIEDEPAVMALVRAVLEGHGYCVVSTESGAEALQLAR